MKFLYFHIPKTAGTSINQLFANNINNYHFHIESTPNLDKVFCHKYNFISGHVSFNRMEKMLDLNEWITLATFREPISYVISHLSWVRKLADPGEEQRLNAHPKIFQDIARKMLEFDFSKAEEIRRFIAWLESIDFYYFHNTQLHYMLQTKNQDALSEQQINKAIENLYQIDFVGIQEDLSSFIKVLSDEFSWKAITEPKENVNKNTYGLNINCAEICEALKPLYQYDTVIYNEAKKMTLDQSIFYKKGVDKTAIGFLDTVNPKEVVGWVRYQHSLKKVSVELVVDDAVVQVEQANIFRKGLKMKKIHPSGHCEFRFALKNPIPTSNVKVRVSSTGQVLPRSKVTS